MYSVTYTCKTRFSDSDAAGVIHFSRLLCYVEDAEHAALAALGFPVDPQAAEALFWPRVNLTADYSGPVFPCRDLTVLLTLQETGKSSLTWGWEIRSMETSRASGTLKTVCCRHESGKLRSVPLPEILRRQLA